MSPVISKGWPPFQKFSRRWRTDVLELSLTNLPAESLKSWFANWSPRKFVFGSDTDVAQLSLTNCHTGACSVLRSNGNSSRYRKEIYIYGEEIKLTFFFPSFQLWRKYVERDNRDNFQFFVPERSIETIISEIIIDDRLFISLNRFCRFKSIEINLFLWSNFYEENSLQCQYRLIGFSKTNHLKVSRHNIARLLDKIKGTFSLVDSG